MPKLAGGGKYALVIGLGGLGLLGVQMIMALSGATVIATDTKPEAMTEAQKLGAITVPSGKNQVNRIREITGGKGVDAAFDFVGVTATINTAMESMALQGRCTIAGIAGHPYEWTFYKASYEVDHLNTYWGTIEDLHDVVALFREDQVSVHPVQHGPGTGCIPVTGRRQAVRPSGRCAPRLIAQRSAGPTRSQGRAWPGRTRVPAMSASPAKLVGCSSPCRRLKARLPR